MPHETVMKISSRLVTIPKYINITRDISDIAAAHKKYFVYILPPVLFLRVNSSVILNIRNKNNTVPEKADIM